MKDELNSKMVEILTSIQTAAGKASDFALEQLPDIAQSYVLYGRVTSTIEFVVFLGISCFLAWRLGFNIRNAIPDKELPNFRSDGQIYAMILQGVGLVVCLPLTVSVMNSAALVWFAPKVWLLKELAGLIK